MRSRSHRVTMRVVARDAVELILAFKEAPAPGQRGSLKAHSPGVFAQDPSPARTVAFGTQSDQTRAGGHSRIDDGQVGKSGLDRQDVVLTGPMALFATDAMIRRPRA